MKLAGSASALLLMKRVKSARGEEPEGRAKPFPREEKAKIYFAQGPDMNRITNELLDSLGGIQALVGKEDIVIIKPNSQQWHQGATNTDVMAAFIQSVLDIPGFIGEIIVADNHQAQVDDSRGWTTDKKNGRFNLNELVAYFNQRGFRNVTKYHWRPAGPNPRPLMMDGSGNSVISHPSDGDGYIWPEGLFYVCPFGHKSLLAYPVFTSSYSGVTIDLKDGPYKNGKYTGQPMKLVNFSALNHHGLYAGATASVKNFMGVVDMSCGYPAPKPSGTYNTHHIGATGIFKVLSRHRDRLQRLPGFWNFYLSPQVFRFRYTGGVLGSFQQNVRRADINIITAIRVGWGSRTDPKKSYPANAVIASTDPVALDYWACENVLLKATKEVDAPESYVRLNDPGIRGGVLRMFLEECRREMGGTLDPQNMVLVSSATLGDGSLNEV